eukprot:scaffold86302_cov60-Phaeocystis_antarctica.AAC.6
MLPIGQRRPSDGVRQVALERVTHHDPQRHAEGRVGGRGTEALGLGLGLGLGVGVGVGLGFALGLG